VLAPATRAVPFNDVGALQQATRDAGDSLAAVLLEPVLGSGGIVPPVAGYLEAAQEAAHDAGALFVLDEVITFRLGPGGHQVLAGLTPDITALGKSIGGGFPVGALGGRAGVMDVFRPGHPRGVSHSGTFNGNPVTVAAGHALLRLLDNDAYTKLDRLGALLAEGLTETIDRLDLSAQVTHVGSLVNVHFSADPIRDYADAQNVDRVAAAAFHLGLLNRGIFIAPRGMMAVSIVTEERDVEKAIAAAADVLAGIAS
jgi:glutamate-1-semialdehyde 2,1-aminomutase